MADDRDEIIRAFDDAVTMTRGELQAWLQTDQSNEVGQKDHEGDESTGHESGRKIVAILAKNKADYDDADLAHMRKVTGYVHRHLAQRPDGDTTGTPWAASLKNWGHDPEKT
ncbi:MAG: DNA-binding protein [uncultured Thermomicrobiales bacterium]|uniref:DNA-binding protein n=1 Tax=uncultured Thermomicrobiales bacterium TaxID=1645740 RepID=A0A6J4U4M3_9BACT|nr:MAG: DNA-binding protein [uncultured Thermomicrobiales bacterium]